MNGEAKDAHTSQELQAFANACYLSWKTALDRADGMVVNFPESGRVEQSDEQDGELVAVADVERFSPESAIAPIRASTLIDAPGRLRRELLKVMQAVGIPDVGSGGTIDDEHPTGHLDHIVFGITWDTCQAMAADPHDINSHHPEAGATAVRELSAALSILLREAGLVPDPLAGLDLASLVDRAGGRDAWDATVAFERPLLVARAIRSALDPLAPAKRIDHITLDAVRQSTNSFGEPVG